MAVAWDHDSYVACLGTLAVGMWTVAGLLARYAWRMNRIADEMEAKIKENSYE